MKDYLKGLRFNLGLMGVVMQCANPIKEEYTSYEVYPCRNASIEADQTYITSCQPNEAEFWSVYGRFKGECLECLADCPTEEKANRLKSYLIEQHESVFDCKLLINIEL